MKILIYIVKIDMSISIYYFNYIHHKDNGFSNINLIILKFIISYILLF